MSNDVATPDGCAYDLIDRALGGFDEYRDFRRGKLARSDYCRWLRSNADELAATGLNEDQLNLSSRFPVDEREYVADSLERLAADGLLRGTRYPEQDFDAFASRIRRDLTHGGCRTYIFPEEARLLFAIAHIVEPRVTVFSGSYYGYWAVWAMPGIIKAAGSAVLLDVDKSVCDIARYNFTTLGMADRVEVLQRDAIIHGAELSDVDLIVLDAEGPKDEGPQHLRDKAIYAPIMEASTPGLRPGGLLVAHNMLLKNLTDNPYFAGRIANNERQYAAFQKHLDSNYDAQCVLHTSEGVGVYRRATC